MKEPMTPTDQEVLERFDEWAKQEIADIGTVCGSGPDDYDEDYNITFAELDFYKRLRGKILEILHEREEALLGMIEEMKYDVSFKNGSPKGGEGMRMYNRALADLKARITGKDA
jgi:hypothetical protein